MNPRRPAWISFAVLLAACTARAQVPCGAARVVWVGGGARHNAFLLSDGSLWELGYNMFGKLGDGTASTSTDFSNDRHAPVRVHGPGDVGFLDHVLESIGGESHNTAVRADGSVWAWGWNALNQIGDGTTTERDTPVPVSGLTNVVALGGRGYHTLALVADGTVRAWGYNSRGQLGDGTTAVRSTPVTVTGLANVRAVTGGGFFSIALLEDGTLRAWGENQHGQLGDGTTTERDTPVAVTGLAGVVQASGGWFHAVGLRADGSVWTWGDNANGELGVGGTADSAVPLRVPGLPRIVSVQAGDCHTAALAEDGTLWTWGCNDVGELGDGTNVERHAPVPVPGLAGVVAFAARDYHNLAVLADGSLRAWGSNNHGQLGDGTTTDRNAPVTLAFTPPTQCASAGPLHVVPPCRIVDTRNATGPDAGAPGLAAGERRTIPLYGRCGVPSWARAVSLNVTATNVSADGPLVLWAGDQSVTPPTITLFARGGRTRANNALVPLATVHTGVHVENETSGPLDLILDVNGWFE